MKKWLVLGAMVLSGFTQAAIVAGKDYNVLPKAQPTAPGKIGVVEFFSYSCIHCYNLEPVMASWKKSQPADVAVSREQVMWGKNMEGFVKLQATMKATGTEEKLHRPAFEAVMKQRINLGDEAVLAGWIAKQPGVDGKRFMETFKSFGMQAAVNRAAKLTRDYQVEGTPLVVVAGKYAVAPAEPQRIVQVVDELVAKVRAEKK
ncbi:thiol:disulfide interchange protein DsbA/DsbL [Rhodobacteraceae bacterium CH30]|nr:thiol:disulfide interchange protein DsbA/DsbL [Rhodobacteraceae bacterium CH30]